MDDARQVNDDIYGTLRAAVDDEGVVTPVVKVRKAGLRGTLVTYDNGKTFLISVRAVRKPAKRKKKRPRRAEDVGVSGRQEGGDDGWMKFLRDDQGRPEADPSA